jgi:phosphoribosylaminoimidazole (AIR) synthetase
MGIGMVAIVDATDAEPVVAQLRQSGENAWIAGEVIAGEREVIVS